MTLTRLDRIKYSLATIVLLMLTATTSAAHVHGQGQLFLSQVENEWHFQFILPSIDIIGFEHEAKTYEEKNMIAHFQQRVTNINEFIALPKDCRVIDFDHSFKYQGNDSLRSEMDASANKHKVSHKDIEISYQVICEKSSQVFDVRLFNWAKSIATLQVQWATNKGQGKAILKVDASALTF